MASTSPLRIEIPLRGYEDIFYGLLGGVPPGTQYDSSLGLPIVNWTKKPTILNLITDIPFVPIRITVERLGNYAPGVDAGNFIPGTYFISQNNQTSFQVTLGKGRNRVIAKEEVEGGRVITFELIATANTMLFESLSREIVKSKSVIDEVEQSLLSKYSTRLLGQVLLFQRLLPDPQMLKILSSKQVVRAKLHYPSTELGTREFIAALSMSTPILVSQRQPTVTNDERDLSQRHIEMVAGEEAHVWFPNKSVTQWIAFSKLAASFKNNFRIIDVKDDRVVVKYKGVLQEHRFNYDAVGADLLQPGANDCFSNIDMFIRLHLYSRLFISMWTYTFDVLVPMDNPIGGGRVFFDSTRPFDSDALLDADPVDPFTDGWVGWPLSGRFEQNALTSQQAQNALDTMSAVAYGYLGNALAYNTGPFTQMFNSIRTDIELAWDILAEGVLSDYSSFPLIGLDLTLPLPAETPLVAGVPVSCVVKYVDQNRMTNLSGVGTVTIIEDGGGASTIVIIAAGYVVANIVPTKAGVRHWALDDGLSFTGLSDARTVVAGPFAKFILSVVGPQVVGVPFMVTLQTADAFDNPVLPTGPNFKVVIESAPGYSSSQVTPNYVELDPYTGTATATVTMLEAAAGQLKFKLNPVATFSNVFTTT